MTASRQLSASLLILLHMDQEQRVADLLQKYRDTLLAMHECRVLAGGDPRRWNRLVDKMQAFHLELRETSEGRDGITSLIGDECVTVRQWSATNALAWAPRGPSRVDARGGGRATPCLRGAGHASRVRHWSPEHGVEAEDVVALNSARPGNAASPPAK